MGCAGCCIIPQRHILGIMGFFAVFNAYTMRVALSIAITEMVIHRNITSGDNSSECKAQQNVTIQQEGQYGEIYDWDERVQGLILSSFYWGYVFTHLPGGIFAEKIGGKYILGLGILSTAILTLLTPTVIYMSKGNWHVMVGLRIIEGLGEGTTYPALNALLAKWIPEHERARMGTLVFAGAQVGTIFTNLISGELISTTKNWASVFYLFGGVSCIWFIFWMLLCYSNPNSHPFITEEEKNFLNEEITAHHGPRKAIPWGAILTSLPLWALIASQFGHDWGFFTMITDLPKYMKDVLKFNIKQSGLWTSIPYLLMWIVSMTTGWLCDVLIRGNHLSTTVSRKMFTAIASFGPAIFMMIASYSGCDTNMAVAMFTVAMGFMGTFYCGMKVNALDLAVNYAGTLMAIVNGIGAFAGIAAPYVVGALTPDRTLLQWRTIFWISFGIFIGSNVIFSLFGSGETQPWNDPDY